MFWGGGEVLRQVKGSLDPEECGVQIDSIRRSAKSNVILTIKGEQEKAKRLGKELRAKTEGVVKSIQDETTLYVLVNQDVVECFGSTNPFSPSS